MNREGMSIGDGKGIYMSECRNWYNGDPILEEYHDHEWCKISHDDDFQFQMLCLEGASVGLSWQIIMHKRAAYLTAFHGFIIDECAAMTDEELEALRSDPGIIRNKNKIYSVRKNAQIVKKIQKEFGSFDAYLWSFTDGRQIDGHWKTPQDIPTVSEVSIAMSKDMKKRGMGFVGQVIIYSFLQSIGVVNDHLDDCEYR
jgi:DNA-3-methyladenine glycosylase I